MSDFIQDKENPLKFEVYMLHPYVPEAMVVWFRENKIEYEYNEHRYGPGSIHTLGWIYLTSIEDAMAFKLRWL